MMLETMEAYPFDTTGLTIEECAVTERWRRVVCRYFNASWEDLRSKSRLPQLVRAKAYLSWMLLGDATLSYAQVARITGHDRSTVVNHERLVKSALRRADTQATFARLRQCFNDLSLEEEAFSIEAQGLLDLWVRRKMHEETLGRLGRVTSA